MAANAELAARRAALVMAGLARLGVPARLLSPAGRDGSQPVAANATDVGRARNRLATVVLA